MQVLAEQIAELLGIAVEKAIELYPVLRGQFIAYRILGTMGTMAGVVLFFLFVGVATIGIVNLVNFDFPETGGSLKTKVIFKKMCMALVAVSVVTTLVSILRYVLAPDLMMLLELMGRV